MKRNVLVELAARHPDCDIVLVVSGPDVPKEPLIKATEVMLQAKVLSSFLANSSAGVRLMAVSPSSSLAGLRKKTFEKDVVTRGWPRMRIPADGIAMYLFDIKDMITFETMCDENVVDILDPETLGDGTRVIMSGANLLPICMGNVEIHRVEVDNGIPEPLKVLSRMATKAMLALSGVHEVPHGFYESLAETFMISPYEGNMNRYNMTFRGKEGSSSEEFTDLSIEQVFALFELRNATTIQ